MDFSYLRRCQRIENERVWGALRRVPSSLQPIFAAGGSRDKASNRDALFSRAEVAAALQEYAHAQGTLRGGGAALALDRLLIGSAAENTMRAPLSFSDSYNDKMTTNLPKQRS